MSTPIGDQNVSRFWGFGICFDLGHRDGNSTEIKKREGSWVAKSGSRCPTFRMGGEARWGALRKNLALFVDHLEPAEGEGIGRDAQIAFACSGERRHLAVRDLHGSLETVVD